MAFLDIRMPGLTGLEVAAALAECSPRTQVVFVTAYDQYAIDAFERGAVDYLQKPVAPERLAATVRRLQGAHGRRRAGRGRRWRPCCASWAPACRRPERAPPLVWLTASAGAETRLIMVDDIAYFQSDTKYTVVMTAEGEALLRKPIRELLEVLDPAIFKQIHRSTIVNLKAIASHRARRHGPRRGAPEEPAGDAGGQPAFHGAVQEHVRGVNNVKIVG